MSARYEVTCSLRRHVYRCPCRWCQTYVRAERLAQAQWMVPPPCEATWGFRVASALLVATSVLVSLYAVVTGLDYFLSRLVGR